MKALLCVITIFSFLNVAVASDKEHVKYYHYKTTIPGAAAPSMLISGSAMSLIGSVQLGANPGLKWWKDSLILGGLGLIATGLGVYTVYEGELSEINKEGTLKSFERYKRQIKASIALGKVTGHNFFHYFVNSFKFCSCEGVVEKLKVMEKLINDIEVYAESVVGDKPYSEEELRSKIKTAKADEKLAEMLGKYSDDPKNKEFVTKVFALAILKNYKK